jgi:hypothetical protein
MEKVIIITDYFSLRNVNDQIKDLNGIAKLKGKGTEDVIEFSDGIILVWDRYEDEWKDWWTKFLKKKKDDVWYVIHHSRGIGSEGDLENTDTLKSKKGAHIPECPVYSNAAAILLDDDSNKKERVISSVFSEKLDLALDFLRSCLSGKDKADVNKLKGFANFSAIKKRYAELDGDCTSDSYINALSKLRDVVLKEI